MSYEGGNKAVMIYSVHLVYQDCFKHFMCMDSSKLTSALCSKNEYFMYVTSEKSGVLAEATQPGIFGVGLQKQVIFPNVRSLNT